MFELKRMKRELLDSFEIEEFQRILLREIKVIEEEIISVDSKGFRQSQAIAYYESRSGKQYREWIKGAYAVGASSQMILAFRQGKGPGSDSHFLRGLKRDSRR
jgi:hypothetical protein